MRRMQEKNDLDFSMGAVTLLYVIRFILALIVYFILNAFWGEYILMSFNDISQTVSIGEGLSKVWFIFLWGGGITYIASRLIRDYRCRNPWEALVKGAWLSLNAGIFEELIYRWLAFFGAMVMIPAVNFATFGFARWMYVNITIPAANWATLGALERQLYHPESWIIGAAIVSASVKFRDAHQRLGFIGWVNSWFIGMVMFFLMFNYGILTAIIAHALYDIAIFAVVAVVESRRTGLRSYQWN